MNPFDVAKSRIMNQQVSGGTAGLKYVRTGKPLPVCLFCETWVFLYEHCCFCWSVDKCSSKVETYTHLLGWCRYAGITDCFVKSVRSEGIVRQEPRLYCDAALHAQTCFCFDRIL